MPSFPPGLPRLDPQAPHILAEEDRQRIAMDAVAGKNPVTRLDDYRNARWTIDAIDSAFARAKIDRDAKRNRAVEARRQQLAEAAE